MAEPFVKNLTWASGIGADGRPRLLAPYENSVDGTQTCPAVSGAANWPSSAFNPATGLFYVMASEACAVYRKNSDWFEYGKSFYGGTTKPATIEGGGKFLRALDLQSGKLVWETPKIGGGATASGLMSTAGGLVVLRRQHGRRGHCSGRKNGTTPLAVRYARRVEVEPDDLRDRRQAVHRRRLGIQGESVWTPELTSASFRPTNATSRVSIARSTSSRGNGGIIGFLEAPPMESTRTFIRHVLSGEGVQRLAVTHDDEVVGWCDIVRRSMEGFRHAGRMGMGVLPGYRGAGLGRRLLTETLGAARALGMERVDLEVFASNEAAIALYRKLGFVVEGIKRRARKLDGEYDDDLIMALFLGD